MDTDLVRIFVIYAVAPDCVSGTDNDITNRDTNRANIDMNSINSIKNKEIQTKRIERQMDSYVTWEFLKDSKHFSSAKAFSLEKIYLIFLQ